MASDRKVTLPGVSQAVLSSCAALVESKANTDDDCRKLVRCARSGQLPHYESLKAVTGFLLANSREADLLLNGARFSSKAMRNLLMALARSMDAPCYAVAAFDVVGTGTGHARYIAALTTLLERVVSLVRSSSGSSVRVVVATRGVPVPLELRGEPMRPLSRADVRDTAVAALKWPVGEGLPATEFDIDIPREYDADVPSSLVLADWIANRVRRMARLGAWSALRDQVRTEVGLDSEGRCASLTASLPAFADAGPSRDELRRLVREGGVVSPLAPGWVREQVEAWVVRATVCRAGGPQ